MLYQVLAAIEQTQGPLSLQQLAEQLGVEPGALEGMIAYWVRKGRIQDTLTTNGCSSCSAACAPGSGGCVFAGETPRTYTLIQADAIDCHRSGE